MAAIGSSSRASAPPGLRSRLLLLAGLSAATALLALAPRPFSSPIARLANYNANSGDPTYDTSVDAHALRRAAAILPLGTTYAIWDDPANAQLKADLRGAADLLFTPSLPVAEASRARWILSYDAPSLAPPGVVVARVVRLGPGIALVQVRR